MHDPGMTNRHAIAALECSDFGQALELFRENAKKAPGRLSFNNLGKFYVDEGYRTKDGTWRNAWKLGLHYLTKAREIKADRVILLNIGIALFDVGTYDTGDYGEAYEAFCVAEKFDSTGIAKYDAGICLLAAKEYEKAKDAFSALTKMDEDGLLQLPEEKDPRIALLFSSILSDPSFERAENAGLIEHVLAKVDEYDRISLLYLLGRYEEVNECCDSFLKLWVPDTELAAMLLDSDSRCCGGKASLIRDSLSIGVDKKTVAKMLRSPQSLKDTAGHFSYCEPLIRECGYYGCERHHTPLPT
jgi:tetratricopeptide (TPR) repeat protein